MSREKDGLITSGPDRAYAAEKRRPSECSTPGRRLGGKECEGGHRNGGSAGRLGVDGRFSSEEDLSSPAGVSPPWPSQGPGHRGRQDRADPGTNTSHSSRKP